MNSTCVFIQLHLIKENHKKFKLGNVASHTLLGALCKMDLSSLNARRRLEGTDATTRLEC